MRLVCRHLFRDEVRVNDGSEQSAGCAYGEGPSQMKKTGWGDGRSEGKRRKVDPQRRSLRALCAAISACANITRRNNDLQEAYVGLLRST